MKKLPLLWTLIFAAPIPLVLCLCHFISRMQKLEELDNEIERIRIKSAQAEETRAKESAALASLKNPDPHYLDKQIETLTFLLPEIKKLQTDLTDDEQVVKRIQYLKEGGNRLLFSEEQIRTHELFRETQEKQQHFIEINEEDLKKLLCLIEGVTIWPYGPKEGRPQLIITDFKLQKIERPTQEKVYAVSMELLKRENIER